MFLEPFLIKNSSEQVKLKEIPPEVFDQAY